MFLNAFFDLETSNGARNLELRAGFFPDMGLDVDLLAISANGLHDESHHDSVVKELKSSYGLKLSVSKAVDLSGSLLNSWVSSRWSSIQLQATEASEKQQPFSSRGCGRSRVKTQVQKPPPHGMPSTACFHCWRSCRCRAFVATPSLLPCSGSTRQATRKCATTQGCWSSAVRAFDISPSCIV